MNLRNLAIWGAILVAAVLIYSVMQGQTRGGATPQDLAYSDLLTHDRPGGHHPRGDQRLDDRRHRQVQPRLPCRGSERFRSGPDPGDAVAWRQVRLQQARPEPLGAVSAADGPAAAAVRPDHPLHAPDAGRRARRDGLRQVEGAAAHREQEPRDLRGRRRRRRGQGRPDRDRRLPEGPGQVPAPGRQDPEGRADGRPARHRQDAARPRRGRRGRRAVLLHLRLRLRRDVRRRRRQPRARHVRAGQEEQPLHHLHRRDRRGRPSPRRRPRRRQRRARADPEPAAGRDGRLRSQRRDHRHRLHQPARRARPGAAAPRPLRPPGGGAQPRHRRPRADPARPHAQRAAGRRRRRAR